MKAGQKVEYYNPKTRRTEVGVLDHVARFRTGFVAAFVRTPEGRLVTTAITSCRPVREQEHNHDDFALVA